MGATLLSGGFRAELVSMALTEPLPITAAVAGCFALGLGAALTPIGEPLSTLASHGLNLPFFGLFLILGPYAVPGVAVAAIVAGFWSRGAKARCSPWIATSARRHVRRWHRE